MAYVGATSVSNFKELITSIVRINQIKKGRYIVVETTDREFWVIPTVTTSGLIKPFIEGLTEKETSELSEWFKKQNVKIIQCDHFYPDDRQDPRIIRTEREEWIPL